MIKLRKKYKELTLLVKKKQYQTIYDNAWTFLIKKSYINGKKDTQKYNFVHKLYYF